MINIFKTKNKYFDYKIGLAGGFVMGIIVYFINYNATSDFINSFIAALKQGVYTFLFGGFIMKLCESIAVKIKPYIPAIFFAMLIPSFVSLVLTFGVHSLKGTPRPIESTIPTAIFVIPSTLIWAYIKRKRTSRP
ncbi:MAG: hypothetical protein B6D61_08080 [Bacteroidetes bacterium 4484_249]|nr:MAG: hypothetical protein B6D61_08080 [Bacteroidetes bacterium 4484_249]